MHLEKLASYLREHCYGRQHSMQSAQLERALRKKGSALRKQIHRLRQKGCPIASDRNGYYYAASAAEVYQTIRQLRIMARGLEKAIRGLELALEQFQQQEGGPV